MKTDVGVAKNYLNKKEITSLERLTVMYLDYAEEQAKNHIPLTMTDWSKKLVGFLEFNQKHILDEKGSVSAEVAKSHAESEWEQYRVTQDAIFKSDFDSFVEEGKKSANNQPIARTKKRRQK